ncbi:threonine/homoserine efflux transporter RhtA [Dysgonomonas alginatilytica]|uniref:Threonine/homoserine efflux transporter RhtA n=1 Tax=Dysgonomonas alginatilytica TaxID=1605892 RepID=A0A2V3PN75_9BACT|nr:DMT family transporter [Dysgonomonas alginatilytica]PXV62333.1 threonine/homoserine efflux transporter RhtA [Dysgonomonas alginatilytica]
MTNSQENNKALLYTTIAVLSWSTVATMFKMALRHFSHFEMLLVASLTALIIFGIVMTIQKKWTDLGKVPARQWEWFALVGLVNPVAYYLVLFKAYALLPAQIAQPINYSWPIILLILLAIFAHKPIPKVKYAGMFLSLSGVALISLLSGGIGGQSLPMAGLLLALLSACLWALYWIINNLNKAVDGTIALFLSFLFGSVYLLIASVFVGINLSSAQGLLSSIYVGIFEMGIPFVFFGLAIRKTNNPALINQMCYLSPFLSLFLIHIILGEQIYFTTYLGLFLIVFGIVFNEYLAKYFSKESKV